MFQSTSEIEKPTLILKPEYTHVPDADRTPRSIHLNNDVDLSKPSPIPTPTKIVERMAYKQRGIPEPTKEEHTFEREVTQHAAFDHKIEKDDVVICEDDVKIENHVGVDDHHEIVEEVKDCPTLNLKNEHKFDFHVDEEEEHEENHHVTDSDLHEIQRLKEESADDKISIEKHNANLLEL